MRCFTVCARGGSDASALAVAVMDTVGVDIGEGSYTVTYNTANFTINKRPITVKADAKTKILNAPDPALTYQITSTSSNLVNGDTFSGALSRVAGENIGSYVLPRVPWR